MTMGRFLDLIDGHYQGGGHPETGAYDINDINDKSPDGESSPYDINDLNDKSPPFGRLSRLCRTSASSPTADGGNDKSSSARQSSAPATDFGRLSRLCRTSSFLMTSLAALERRCPDYV